MANPIDPNGNQWHVHGHHFAQGRRELGDATGVVPNRCGTDPADAAGGGNGGANDLQGDAR